MSHDDALRGVSRRLNLAAIISVSINDSKALWGSIWLRENTKWPACRDETRHMSSRQLGFYKLYSYHSKSACYNVPRAPICHADSLACHVVLRDLVIIH
jgi:hypothetical protein